MSAGKTELRSTLLRRRRALVPEDLALWSAMLKEVVVAEPRWQAAAVVAAFVGVRGEPDTRPILEATVAAGKVLLLPRVRERARIEMARVTTLEALVPAGFGLVEPPDEVPSHSTSIDLVLVPGLAFASDGARIGFGAGYYDRWLAGLSPSRPWRLGLAFSCFLDPPEGPIPVDANDVFVDAVATELGVTLAGSRSA